MNLTASVVDMKMLTFWCESMCLDPFALVWVSIFFVGVSWCICLSMGGCICFSMGRRMRLCVHVLVCAPGLLPMYWCACGIMRFGGKRCVCFVYISVMYLSRANEHVFSCVYGFMTYVSGERVLPYMCHVRSATVLVASHVIWILIKFNWFWCQK